MGYGLGQNVRRVQRPDEGPCAEQHVGMHRVIRVGSPPPGGTIRAELLVWRNGYMQLSGPLRSGNDLPVNSTSALGPEVGLRELLQRHPDDLLLLPVAAEAVVRDMDTRAEYEAELRRWQGEQGRKPEG